MPAFRSRRSRWCSPGRAAGACPRRPRTACAAPRSAAAAGYTVALVDTANDRRWQEQSFEALRAGPVDGYLLFEVDAPEALGNDPAVVLMEAEGAGRPSVR